MAMPHTIAMAIAAVVAAAAPTAAGAPAHGWIDPIVQGFSKHIFSDALTVLVLTVAARAGWGLALASWRVSRFYLSPAVAQFPVDLGKLEKLAVQSASDFAGVKVFCQIVRFGADDYLEKLASEQEKYEGRLQNRVLPVSMAADAEGYRGHFLLPVHRRLGTQFKMFVVATSSDHAKALFGTEFFGRTERHAKRRGRRISFVLTTVDVTTNTERSTVNNIVYPSNLHDFATRNRFGSLYLWLQQARWRYSRWRQGRRAR